MIRFFSSIAELELITTTTNTNEQYYLHRTSVEEDVQEALGGVRISVRLALRRDVDVAEVLHARVAGVPAEKLVLLEFLKPAFNRAKLTS